MTNLAAIPAIAQDSLEALAGLYKACGDPLRLEILRVLQRDTFGVQELSQLFDMRQSGMSHHLKVLTRAGLAEPQREGNSIFYRRPLKQQPDFSATESAVRQVFAEIDRLPLPAERRQRLDAIRRQRAAQSQAFFARYANQFRQQQELIAAYELYAGPVLELVQNRFAGHTGASALEVGPGEGAFLAELSGLFTSVVGVDNSREMLDRARALCGDLGNVRLIQGETGTVVAEGRHFELVVANMVLHHVPSPPDIFADSAALLTGDGLLIVSDLCSHDQNWARANCGDLWLGFEPEELDTWADEAGLVPEETLFIGLRNGFQVQVKAYRRRPEPGPDD